MTCVVMLLVESTWMRSYACNMRVLIACEYTGTVRQAFRELGHDAYSCDVTEAEDNSIYHIQCDVMSVLNDSWDLMIAHPPCTYLCNSGVRWVTNDIGRQARMRDASIFFLALWECNIPRVCIENPVPSKRANLPSYSQIVQPWQYGHGHNKRTCLWIRGMPLLRSTSLVTGRRNITTELGPHKHRRRERARTYDGIANAMARQWGGIGSMTEIISPPQWLDV
jgi:hypothetical protein